MSFYKDPKHIPAAYGGDVEFYDAEMLLVAFETKPALVEKLLPPPLRPVEPIAIVFVANYPRTNFGAAYREAALYLLAEHNGAVGRYCLAMPVTDDMVMAGGREIYGYPKKLARVQFAHDERTVSGSVERHGNRFFRIRAN